MDTFWNAVGLGKPKRSGENSRMSHDLYSGSSAQDRSRNRTSYNTVREYQAGPASSRHSRSADNRYLSHRQHDPPTNIPSSAKSSPRATNPPGTRSHGRDPSPGDDSSKDMREQDIFVRGNSTPLANISSGSPIAKVGQEASSRLPDSEITPSSNPYSVTTNLRRQDDRARSFPFSGREECHPYGDLQELNTLKRELQQLQVAYDKNTNLLNQSERKAQSLEKQVQESNYRFELMTKRESQAQARLQAECSYLKGQLHKNELEIGNLQRTELAMFRRRQPLMDEKAKDDLRDSLRAKVHAISRPHFRKLNWRTSVGLHPNLDEMFPEMFASRWVKGHWSSIRDHPDFSTSAFVDAVLFSMITTKFFKNPFFRTEHNPAFKSMLDRVYFQSYASGIGDAECWREKTASLLKGLSLTNPLLPELTDDNPSSDLIINQTSDNILTSLSTLQTLCIEVTQSERTKLSNKVKDLVRTSAALAEEWHCNEFRLVIIDLDWLERNRIEWRNELGSKYCTPKNRGLEENVNYDIVAVISPGFIRYERGDNAGKEIEIVWEKATILVDEVQGCKIGDVGDSEAPFDDGDPMETDAWHGE